MNTKEIRTLTGNIYNYAKQNSIPEAKEAYLALLETAKESPSIAKIVFNDALKLNKDAFFKEARESAKITGSSAPISDAVKKNSAIKDIIAALQKDKEIKQLRASLDKTINQMYKKTKSVRKKAVLVQNEHISLANAKNNKFSRFISRIF